MESAKGLAELSRRDAHLTMGIQMCHFSSFLLKLCHSLSDRIEDRDICKLTATEHSLLMWLGPKWANSGPRIQKEETWKERSVSVLIASLW